MRNLYDILGLKKDAGRDAIKRAYKKKAKEVHPDMKEGNADKFALVKKAFDVLSDKERKDKYDATGDIDEKTPDNAQSQAVNYLAQVLDMVLGQFAQNGRSPLEADLIHEMRKLMGKTKTDLQSQLRVFKNIHETDKKIKGRFKRKEKKAERNVFEDIVHFRVENIRGKIEQLEKNIKACEDSFGMIDEFVYRYDEPQCMSEREITWQNMGITF